jgi:hypothetical protein
MLVQIMNNVGLYIKNIVKNVGIFNDIVYINNNLGKY